MIEIVTVSKEAFDAAFEGWWASEGAGLARKLEFEHKARSAWFAEGECWALADSRQEAMRAGVRAWAEVRAEEAGEFDDQAAVAHLARGLVLELRPQLEQYLRVREPQLFGRQGRG